jgi:Tol biopolymer transport system component
MWVVPTIAVLVASVLVGTPLPASAAPPAVAGAAKRISVGADGHELTGLTDSSDSDVSADGRFVAFTSGARNLVTPSDTFDYTDVFVTDRLLGTTEKVSVSSSEVTANNSSGQVTISNDGRYVAFSTMATNLGSSLITFGWSSVYVRDRQLGTTVPVSMNGGAETFAHANFPVISGDGSKVAFVSQFAYVAGDTNSVSDVFVRTLAGGAIARASVTDAEGQADGSGPLAIDDDGSLVAYTSAAAAYGGIGATDVYVRDLSGGTTQRASVNSGGTWYTTGASYPQAFSASGRYLVMDSSQAGLVAGTGAIGNSAVFLRDRTGATTTLVSKLASGVVDGYATRADISADGGRVVYQSGNGAAAAPGATCASFPVLWDRTATSRLPLFNPTTAQCGGSWPSISGDGRSVIASSLNPLVGGDPNDTSAKTDVYLFALANNFFSDVPATHPFFEEVSWAMDLGIAAGYDDGLYHPTTPVSRQAMAAFMYRMAGSPAMAMPDHPTFSDVPVSHPFFAAVEWAASQGIVGGYSDGTFRPTIPVTRQAITKMVYEYLGEPLYFILIGTQTYTDVPQANAFWFDIEFASFHGIARGFSDGTFHPTDAVTRQSAAAFLYRTHWFPPPAAST